MPATMRFAAIALSTLLVGGVASGQQPPTGQPSPAPQSTAPDPSRGPGAKPEEGIPITNATVQKACGSCHKSDDKQQMSRISFQRNTPEGWQETIRRMVALNNLQIDPATAREVVKYLSDNLGLAPEEAKPAAFEVERRLIDFKYAASTDTEAVCTKCHSMGRVISQRRTREEWNLLIAMHRGWYPLVDNQAFRRGGPPPREPGADGRPPDARQPVDRALEHLSRTFPLNTPHWAAWSATMRPPRLEGTWALSGWEAGKGAVYGRVVISPVPSTPDEFRTEISWIYGRTGQRVTRTGRTIIYTGYQWRGRSTAAAPSTSSSSASNGSSGSNGGNAAPDVDTSLREVMFIDRDWRIIEGRWFTGGYDELGMDIKLERIGRETSVLGTNQTALRAGATAQELKIFGANLPAMLQPTDVDLGPGITVTRVVNATADEATIQVDVAASAVVGARDLFVAGASRPRAVAVYDRIEMLKVTPAWAMARVGGVVFPKMLAQFEARAFHNGADKRPDTPDDVDLGVVPATWTIEEFAATYDDDDIRYVGSIDRVTGRFTPNVDGPNTARRGSRNNIGDVYAVATYTPETVDGKKPATLRARAHLLVTVPLYIRFESRGGLQ